MATVVETPTKAVMAEVPRWLLEQRQRTGADMWDEMWEGVLHMPPMPTPEHQELEGEIETWLRLNWARPNGNKVYHQINLAPVGKWPNDYRIPDLLLLTSAEFPIIREQCFEGAPLVVVEIRSPRDESLDKLEFYARLGVPEAWIIDRDARSPEVYQLRRDTNEYDSVTPDTDGWVHSTATGIIMKATDAPFLAIMIKGDESTLAELPES